MLFICTIDNLLLFSAKSVIPKLPFCHFEADFVHKDVSKSAIDNVNMSSRCVK